MNTGDKFDLNSWEDTKTGRWLKHGHLCGQARTFTITKAYGECMGRGKDGKEIVCGILEFQETELHYGLPRTLEKVLAKMFGPKPSDLIGKRVTFIVAQDTFGKELVDCIRVSGSPDLAGPMDVTVKYPAKTGRKPKHFNLAVTDAPMGLPGSEPEPEPPTEDQLQQALAAIGGVTAEGLEPVLVSLRAHKWTPEQSRAIKGAIANVRK